MKLRPNITTASTLFVSALILFIILSAYWGIDSLGQSSSGKSMEMLEDAIRRAAVQCYAIEGSYPPDVDYLADHYGIVLNRDVYYYHYEVIGSNIMPDILVMKK